MSDLKREMVEDFFKAEEFVADCGPHKAAWYKWYRGDMDGKNPDMVQNPPHYKQFGMEVIDIIRHVLGPEGFLAYCIGNELKYRLRAGDKGDAAQDIAKAMKYREFREAHCAE